METSHLVDRLCREHEGAKAMIKRVIRYDRFNRMQSECIDSIFSNSGNILVNAPTGSGKTHIFELCILKEYLDSGCSDSFKAVVLVPIKSLCNEICVSWSSVFESLQVLELNSDFTQDRDSENSEIHKANIIITTPEKFGMLMKRPAELDYLLNDFRVIVVDELHILDDCDRGPCLESALSRLKYIQSMDSYGCKNKKTRIVCASATFTNGEQICKWLNVNEKNFLKFSEEFRPVQLSKYVFGYQPSKSPFMFDVALNYKILDTIMKFSYGKNCLVFCPTQKSAQKTAEEIIKQADTRQFVRNEAHLQELSKAVASISEMNLKNCIINGVGYHSAGLDQQNRREVERLFRLGQLPVLCTTSTLAQGVNLPAFLVVIKGTKSYKGSDKGFDEYKYQEIMQMMGRAGRPQFDTSGVCVIMTETCRVDSYQNMKDNKIEINSYYMNNVKDDLGAEISLGTLRTLDCALAFFKHSFFYVRLFQGCQRIEVQGIFSKEEKVPSDLNGFLRAYIKKLLDELESSRLVTKEGDLYSSSLTLKEICWQNVSIEYLSNILLQESIVMLNKENILNYLSTSSVFSRIPSRLSERKDLNDINGKVHLPLKKSVCTADRKVYVLIQAHIQKMKLSNWDLKVQMNDIIHTCVRLLKCYFKIYIDRKHFINAAYVLDYINIVRRKIDLSDKSNIYKQINNLDASTCLLLSDTNTTHNILSVREIPGVKPSVLACIPHIKMYTSGASEKSENRSLYIDVCSMCNHSAHNVYHAMLCNGDSIVYYKYINLYQLYSHHHSNRVFVCNLYSNTSHIYLYNDYYYRCIYHIDLLNSSRVLGGDIEELGDVKKAKAEKKKAGKDCRKRLEGKGEDWGKDVKITDYFNNIVGRSTEVQVEIVGNDVVHEKRDDPVLLSRIDDVKSDRSFGVYETIVKAAGKKQGFVPNTGEDTTIQKPCEKNEDDKKVKKKMDKVYIKDIYSNIFDKYVDRHNSINNQSINTNNTNKNYNKLLNINMKFLI